MKIIYIQLIIIAILIYIMSYKRQEKYSNTYSWPKYPYLWPIGTVCTDDIQCASRVCEYGRCIGS